MTGATKTALWIAHVRVTDADAYGRYAALAGPAIAAHGGVFLARGGRYVQLEGNDRPRNVVARFPSLEVPRPVIIRPNIRKPCRMPVARPSGS